MGLFKKKNNPLSAQEQEILNQIKTLNDQISDLQKYLKKISNQPPNPPSDTLTSQTKYHTTRPDDRFSHLVNPPNIQNIDLSPDYFQDNTLKKFDLIGFINKIKKSLKGQTPSNPQLITLLASGNKHGLRPLRKEQKIARNRFIILVLMFLFLLWLIAYLIIKNQ